MSYFIKLTLNHGIPAWVNLNKVIYFRPTGDNSIVFFETKTNIVVKETVEEIEALMRSGT